MLAGFILVTIAALVFVVGVILLAIAFVSQGGKTLVSGLIAIAVSLVMGFVGYLVGGIGLIQLILKLAGS